MKNISISNQNWRELRKLRDKLDLKRHNDTITYLLSKESQEVDNVDADDDYNIQSASCSECRHEFDFIVDQKKMFVCCPNCGKTKKITVD